MYANLQTTIELILIKAKNEEKLKMPYQTNKEKGLL